MEIVKTVGLSEEAIGRINAVKINNDKLILKLKIVSGGCAGFQTIFDFIEYKESEQAVYIKNEDSVYLEIDKISYELILDNFMTIDFINKLGGKFFILKTNAKNSCSCGTSFEL